MPHMNTQHCLGEWNVHGSCCEVNSLTALYKKEKDALEKSAADIEGLVAKVRDMFQGLIDKLQKEKDAELEVLKLSGKLKFIEADILFLQIFLKSPVFTNFKEHSKTCWDKMNSIRTSSFCSICSGRGRGYFTNKDKIIIDIKDCAKVIDSCEDFFLNMGSFLKSVDIFVSDVSVHSQEKNKKEINGIIEAIKSFEMPANLEKSFILYTGVDLKKPSNDNKKESVREAATKQICNSLLRIRQKPYVSLVSSIVKPVMKPLDDLITRMPNMTQPTTTSSADSQQSYIDRMNEMAKLAQMSQMAQMEAQQAQMARMAGQMTQMSEAARLAAKRQMEEQEAQIIQMAAQMAEMMKKSTNSSGTSTATTAEAPRGLSPLATLIHPTGQATSNWRSMAETRLLQLDQNNGDPFQADSLTLAPNDNLFVAQGTQNDNTISLIPMNSSLTFL